MRTLSSATERVSRHSKFSRAFCTNPVFRASRWIVKKRGSSVRSRNPTFKPGTIASAHVSTAWFTATHPYGLRSSGEVESVAKITRDDLIAFYRDTTARSNAVVAIMGDLSRDEAAAIAERSHRRTADRRAPRPCCRRCAIAEKATAPGFRIRRRKATFSSARRACAATTRIISRLFVGNYVLGGGGFESRINDEVRQKRGLAYSTGSYFSPLAQRPFVISMQTKGDRRAKRWMSP